MHSLCSSARVLSLLFLRLAPQYRALLILRFAAHCVSLLCLYGSLLGLAMPFLSMLCLCYSARSQAIPSLFVARPLQSNSSHFEDIPLLSCATQCSSFALPSKPCQSFAKMFQAMQCLCGSARFTARPCFSVHGSALLFLCHSTPRLCFSSLCSASRFLCSSSPINSFSGRFTAMMFPCKSLYCSANPLQINSWLCAAFALLSCALPCHSLLCPCAAVQETSAQRKRPLPELRHWPRPR